MGQWMAVTIQQVADTATYRDVMCRAWYNSTQGVDDSSNEFSTSGDFPGNVSNVSKDVYIPFNGGSQKLHEKVLRVNKAYGATTDVYFAAWLTGINHWGGGQVYDNATYTVPARPYVPPTAPNGLSVVRSSDGQQTVMWTRQASTAGRYQAQRVKRRTFVNGSFGSWQTLATLGTDYTTVGSHSYADKTTSPNRVYQYLIEAINSSGTASSAPTDYVYTTPTPASLVYASKSGADIEIQVVTTSWAAKLDIELEQSVDNGGTWSPLATVDVVPGSPSAYASATYTHAGPSGAESHVYRASVTVADTGAAAGNGLTSPPITSNVVQIAAPPNAPTNLSPAGARDATEPIPFTWLHNPVDTSAQSKFQVRHRADSFDAWTAEAEVVSSVSEWTLPADTYSNGDVPEWEVRTWGQHADPSPWSSTASFPTYARPTVAISSPAGGATLTDSDLSASWSYYQAEFFPQTQWRATLLNDGATVEVKSGSGTTGSVAFDTPGEDGESYTIRVEVSASFGLWSEPDEVVIDVEYLPPAFVDVAPVWDRESGAVVLTLTAQPWDDVNTVQPITATVHRSSDGGRTWKLIARNVPLQGAETAVPDATAPTRTTVLYRVTSTSELPSTAVAEPVELVIDEMQFAYLGRGPGFATVLVFYGNLNVGSSTERAEVVEYFDGRTGEDNRPAGVLISGQQRSRELPITARLINAEGYATRDDFEDAALEGGVMLYRDNTGRIAYVKIGRVDTGQTTAPFTEVSLNLTEVGAVA